MGPRCSTRGPHAASSRSSQPLPSWGAGSRRAPPRAEPNDWMADIEVNAPSSDNDTFPSVAAFPNGTAIVVWRHVGATYDIYAQLIDQNGTRLWTDDLRVNQVTTGARSNPDVAVNSSGDAVVVWDDSRRGAPRN